MTKERLLERKKELLELLKDPPKQKVETYSRVCGFYRPTDHFNEGKAEEYKNRKMFDPNEPVDDCLLGM